MTDYDYREYVKEDICAYITDNNIHWTDADRNETEEKLRDDLWCEDSVTGNGSGSYTFSIYQAAENLCHNLELLGEALNEFGYKADYLMNNGAEACDVIIRCYLLGECVAVAMDALDDGGWNGEEEEEPEE